jgi:hypothetical protein
MFMPRTVGVAPGTTTIHLGANPAHWAPDPMRYNAYDRTHDEAFRRSADPAGFFTQPRYNVGVTNAHGLQGSHVWNPYQADYMRMNGMGAIDTRARMRWDIIAAIGGGATLIALATGLIASALK